MKVKNFLFLKETISSDFSIVKTKLKPSKIYGARLALKTRNFGGLIALNNINFSMNFKSFVRRLLFTVTGKHNTKFYVENAYLCALFKTLLEKAKITTLFTAESSLVNVNRGCTIAHAVLLDATMSRSSIIKTLVHNNILLITRFNNIYETKMLGTYKNFNEITELKKILFFFVVIKKIAEYKKRFYLNKIKVKQKRTAF